MARTSGFRELRTRRIQSKPEIHGMHTLWFALALALTGTSLSLPPASADTMLWKCGIQDDTSAESCQQPRHLKYLKTLRDLNMAAVVDFISGSHFSNDPSGHIPDQTKAVLDDFFKRYGGLFQFYEAGNEPYMFGGGFAETLEVARYIDHIKPSTVQLVAPGWAYGGGKGTPKNWDADPAFRRQVEDLCQVTNGHSYGYSYADNQGGSFVEDLKTFGGVEDGWPREYVNTETGANDWHSEDNGPHLASSQPHAQAFDRILRAHLAVVNRTMQHAAIFDELGLIKHPANFDDPALLTASPGVGAEDNRVRTFRRLALAYATHGAPLPYIYRNPMDIQDKHVYVRAVDTSTLAPLPGSGGKSNKILLNFVNFEHVRIRVTLPRPGSYNADRFGPHDTYAASHSRVLLTAATALELDVLLPAHDSVQYILEPRHGMRRMFHVVAAPSPSLTGYTAMVDPTVRYPPFEGWGVSLAWWAKVVGDFPDAVRKDYLDKAFDPVKGLGLNVVRYNIGGGENPAYLAPNRQFLQFRTAISGFEPSPGKWDWSADAAQRRVLTEAIARGANQLEAFANSPPYWMTRSRSVTGNHAGANNLKPEAIQSFADYLTATVRHFHDAWGITFRTVEPLNEPAGGWGYGNGQEGCHVDRPAQSAVIEALKTTLSRGVLPTTVSASDENTIDDSARTFETYTSSALKAITRINAHSYGGSARTRLADFAASAHKDLWLSEYGDSDASGMIMSRTILEDINRLHPTAWVYWQFVDSVQGWGMLKNPLTSEATTGYTINEKYYVMGNYSRFIRPGYRFLAMNDPNSLAAYDENSHTLVVVTTNTQAVSTHVHYDLSRFDEKGRTLLAYRTSATEHLEPLRGLTLRNQGWEAECPAASVTTFVVQGPTFRSQSAFSVTDFYKIVNRKSGLLLEEAGDSLTDFSGVTMGPEQAGKLTQQWRILGQGTGMVKLVNRFDGLVLEVGGDSVASGASVDLFHDKYEGPGVSNQLWRLERLADGSYRLVNSKSGLGIEAADATAAVVQKPRTAGLDQAWHLIIAP